VTRDQAEAVDAVEAQEANENPGKGTLDVSLDEGFASGNTSSVRRRLSTGTLIMGGVILMAGGSLWSMRAIDRAAASGPVTSKELESLFDAALKKDAEVGRMIETDAGLLLRPTEAANEVTVALKDLTKNPFVIWRDETGGSVPTNPGPEPPPVDTLADRIALWNEQVDSAAGAIKVKSTMESKGDQGPVGLANVNGHMMREGDLFAVEKSDVEFTIARIVRSEVTFRAYNTELKHERLVIVKVNRKW